MTTSGIGNDEIQQESSWRYPLVIFVITLILSAVFLYYYVGPSLDELGGNEPTPTISEERVKLAVGDLTISIPANYTIYPRDRRDGSRESVYLYALWPTFSGYSAARRNDFVEDDPQARRIDIIISERIAQFGEQDRIEKLFLPRTKKRSAERVTNGLTRYEFRDRLSDVPTNGYAENELFIGIDQNDEAIAILCELEAAAPTNPHCWREYELSDQVSLIYKFKKPYLQEWRAIDRQVQTFLAAIKR
ncbi:MAG: hypothetical protein AAF668_12865 [Pseudomonadota bacterium]